MNQRVRNISKFLFILFALASSGFSQSSSTEPQNSKQSLTFKYGIYVTDGKDGVIVSSRKEDFIVTVNGTPVSDFTLGSVRVPTMSFVAVDNSGSMRKILGDTITASNKIISMFSEEDVGAVVRFVSSDNINLISDFESDPEKLSTTFDLMFIESGKTAVIDAIYVCAEIMGKISVIPAETKKTVVVISDGEDRDSFYTREQLADMLRRTNVGVVFVAIHSEIKKEARPIFSKDPVKASQSLVEYLVSESGGFVLYPKTLKEFSSKADRLLPVLQNMEYIEVNGTDELSDIKIELSPVATRKNYRLFTRRLQ